MKININANCCLVSNNDHWRYITEEGPKYSHKFSFVWSKAIPRGSNNLKLLCEYLFIQSSIEIEPHPFATHLDTLPLSLSKYNMCINTHIAYFVVQIRKA